MPATSPSAAGGGDISFERRGSTDSHGRESTGAHRKDKKKKHHKDKDKDKDKDKSKKKVPMYPSLAPCIPYKICQA